MTSESPGTTPNSPGSDDGSRGDPDARRLLADCAPRSPFRAAEWRWLLAAHLAAGRKPPRRAWADRWVRAAARLRESGAGPRPGRDRPCAAIAEAHQLRYGGGPRRRWEVELRLLAGQGGAEIADRLGVAPETIEAYEMVFFDVAARLGQADYIALLVDPTMTLFKGGATPETASMMLAYRLGPLAADPLVDFLLGDRAGAAGVRPATTPDPRVGSAIRSAVAAMTCVVDESSAGHLIRVHAYANELERGVAARSAGPVSMPVRVTGDCQADVPGRAAAAPEDSFDAGLKADFTVLKWADPGPCVPTLPADGHRAWSAAG